MKLSRKDTVVKYFEKQKESIDDKYQEIAFLLILKSIFHNLIPAGYK